MKAIETKIHAKRSPSSSYRWLTCPGSVRLEAQFPDRTSEAAEEGTLAHALGELKLKQYFYPGSLPKTTYTAEVKRLKENSLWDKDIEGYTDVYLDYVKGLALSQVHMPSVAIEKWVDIRNYVSDCFGTADCILIGGSTLHVFDFKYGKSPEGRVEAEGNTQMRLYALGAYDVYKLLYPISRIAMHIVQPRLPDGISSWEISLQELLEFGRYAGERAKLTEAPDAEFYPDPKACRYCKAGALCRARAEANTACYQETKTNPALLAPEEVGTYLTAGNDVEKWLKSLQAYALSQCLAGKEIPGWKAVEGRGSREWSDMDQAFSKLQESGIPETVLYERKPLTLAQIEKEVGKKLFQETVGNLVTKKPGKPALVVESDKRPAITNVISAAEAFK